MNINIDILIVTLYLLGTLLIGLYYSRGVNNMDAYSRCDKPVTVTILAATLFATSFESSSFFGLSERIISVGLFFSVMYLVMNPISELFLSEVLIPRLNKFKGLLTAGDIMNKIYGKPSQIVTGVAGILLSFGYVAAQVSAMGYIFYDLLGISKTLGIVIGCGVVLIYSVAGGLKSVLYTDLIQFAFLIVTIPTICNLGLIEIGGYSAVYENMVDKGMTFLPEKELFWYFFMMSIVYLIPFVDPAVAQRLLLTQDTKKAQKSMRYSIVIYAIYNFIIVNIAVIAFILIPNLDANLVVPELIKMFLPIGIKGFVISGLLAAIMSTVDSYLNVSGVSVVNDIINPIWPDMQDKKKLFFARAITILIGVLSIFAALYSNSIIELILFFLNFWGPIVVIPLIAGILGYEGNSKLFLAASGSGLLVVAIWTIFGFEEIFGFDSLVPGMLINSFVLFTCKGLLADHPEVKLI